MSKIDIERAELISKNLQLIMDKSDLTVDGLEEYTGISKPTLNRAILKTSNLSPNKVNDLAKAFHLDSKEVTSKFPVRTRHLTRMDELIDFKNKNLENFKYFISESQKHNAHAFVKSELFKDPYYKEERKMKEIKNRLRKSKNYQDEFSDNAIEQAIKRLVIDCDFFIINRKSPKGKVFYYKVKG
ncbi:hypothetical protein KZP23_16585 [Echinicola marina]|uniref:helix-turn-helix domain-containing protein n=1 Tax=Echinicola marina TaxID=2859768 RepID=UPI001CF6C327|nr:helix-turn-helix transcriptional regulator [Echinicola marina]UCS92307.1 hypothetical protein KZP23_16585 [Echinicola marina]